MDILLNEVVQTLHISEFKNEPTAYLQQKNYDTECDSDAHLSLLSLLTPSRPASWFRLCSCWAGTRGAWLSPASRSLLTCSCCKLLRRCWIWSTVLRRLLSVSPFATCSLFTTFFWALSSYRRSRK